MLVGHNLSSFWGVGPVCKLPAQTQGCTLKSGSKFAEDFATKTG
jgi:hypothetical protein